MMNGHVTPTKTHSFHTTATGEKFAREKKMHINKQHQAQAKTTYRIELT